MGNSVIGRMDELGSRMDELENSIAQLMDEVGIEATNGSVQTSNENTVKRTTSTQALI